MELIQVGKNTYYIKNPTNIGIYHVNERDVYLIDSGNDKDAGRKILKIVEDVGWNIIGIINTHSNADHIGGNKIIQDRTNAKIYAHGIENAFIQYPILEPSFLYGGYPFEDLKNKFLMAKGTDSIELSQQPIKGLKMLELKGHYFDMIGIQTDDDVYFLADALFSAETITKYHLFYIFDVQEYLNTLDYLATLKGNLYIASHVEAKTDIQELIGFNRNKIHEIIHKILDICTKEQTFEEILKQIMDEYQLQLNMNQYVLVGSTIRSYLSYLYDHQKVTYQFVDNKMLWKSV